MLKEHISLCGINLWNVFYLVNWVTEVKELYNNIILVYYVSFNYVDK